MPQPAQENVPSLFSLFSPLRYRGSVNFRRSTAHVSGFVMVVLVTGGDEDSGSPESSFFVEKRLSGRPHAASARGLAHASVDGKYTAPNHINDLRMFRC